MHSGEILSKFFFMPDAGHLIMVCIGFFFIYLAISRKIETALFLPFGFGIILMNIPGSDGAEGIFKLLYETGILNGEVLPLLLFLGIGAMTDFSPLIQKPGYMLLGIIGQSGIIAAVFLARCLGYEFNDAVSAGIIGAADGPTAIVVGTRLNTRYLASVIVASYSYMALVPLVQPLAIRLLTTKKERKLSARCVVPPLKKEKINPIVGSAANSAFPISSRVAQTQALKSRDDNIILSDALAANCAGQIATIFSGGILMAIFS